MNNIKEVWNEYKGAIIGIIVAILILVTQLDKLILEIVSAAMKVFPKDIK